LVKFLLNPKEQSLLNKFNVYAYFTNSKKKRFFGYSHIADFTEGYTLYKWAEISFKPFGYLLTLESPPAHKEMMNKTHFKNYCYDHTTEVRLGIYWYLR
jgi:hypothetical protein